MKKYLILFAVLSIFASALAGEKDIFSTTPGSGDFYALRHKRPEGKPLIEIVASPIALNRAMNQARIGDYELEIKGPFPGHVDAVQYIWKKWDPDFHRPKRRRHLPWK